MTSSFYFCIIESLPDFLKKTICLLSLVKYVSWALVSSLLKD